MQLWKSFVGLAHRYAQGVSAIRPALFNCLLTCVAAAVANLAYEGWGHDELMSLTRRILVGYLGAAGIVVLILPWLQEPENRTETDAPLDIGRIFGRGSGIHQGVEE